MGDFVHNFAERLQQGLTNKRHGVKDFVNHMLIVIRLLYIVPSGALVSHCW